MVKKADIDKLEERIVYLESKIKVYDNMFDIFTAAMGKFQQASHANAITSPSVTVKATPAPVKNETAVKVEQGIKDAGGFKETKVGESKPVEEMSGKYDNPIVIRDPPKWSKGSFVGKKYSECTPDFLKDLAGFLDWAASDDKKNNTLTAKGKPRYTYREQDAKRARYWANKIRIDGTENKDTAPTQYTFDDA
jgi:hypothetical protein